MVLTGAENYFEDFVVGDVYVHERARTVIDFDNYAMTHLTLNTAQAHFNVDNARELLDGQFRERLVLGPCTIAIVIGLTTQDMAENAFMDIHMTGVRLFHPVFAGDTLYAESEVLELSDCLERKDAGIMRYRFTGKLRDGTIVAQGERTVLLKRRSHWCKASENKGGAV
jgi:acyl dehydratase